MATELFANNFTTLLAGNGGSITLGATTLHVADVAPSALQSGQFRIRIDNEILIVTSGAGTTTWTVTRGAESTAAASHGDSATVAHILTAGGLAVGYEQTVHKAQPNGYAGLDGSGLVPTTQLPITSQLLLIPVAGTPLNTVGLDGDYALDIQTGRIYGPKAVGAWDTTTWKMDGSGADAFATWKSGAYLQAQTNINANAALGNGTLRLAPFVVSQAVTIASIGGEFSVAGDAASLLRLCLYSDDGSGYPGSLLLDGGSISTGSGNAGTVATGGTPGVYMRTLSPALTLQPGIYWYGGVLQGVTTTQPTIRCGVWTLQFAIATSGLPAAGQAINGYSTTGVTGTLPSSFVALSSAGQVGTGIPRTLLLLQ